MFHQQEGLQCDRWQQKPLEFHGSKIGGAPEAANGDTSNSLYDKIDSKGTNGQGDWNLSLATLHRYIYSGEVLCDVVDMDASHILLDQSWQFDMKGKEIIHSFMWKGHKIIMLPSIEMVSDKETAKPAEKPYFSIAWREEFVT